MKLSGQIKPISYLKAHASKVVKEITERRLPLIITQNGEAKVVIQDLKSYESQRETMALLRILALGNKQVEAGEVRPSSTVLKRIRKRRNSAR